MTPDRLPRMLLSLLVAVAAAGCGTKGIPVISPPAPSGKTPGVINDRAKVQNDLMNLADDFITAVVDVFDEVESRSQNPQKTVYVLEQKTDAVKGALSNAVNPLPLAGMMDMLVLVTLTRTVSEAPSSRELLGAADADAIVRVLRSQEDSMWKVALRYVSQSQLDELRELINRWRADNPQQRYVARVRMVDFVEAGLRSGQAQRTPNSILSLLFLDPLAGMDPAVREIEQSRDMAERMFFFAQRAGMLFSWQMEMLYRRMLTEPQVTRVFTDLTAFSNATVGFTKSTTEFANTVETFRKEIPAERTQAIDQMGKIVATQREQAIDQLGKAVAVERDAAIRQATTQISTLREQAVDQLNQAVATQRDAVVAQATTRVSAEREAAINQLMQSTQKDVLNTLQQTELAMERSIDRLYSRMLTLAIVTVSAIFVMLVLYRLLFRPAAVPMPGDRH